jgi:hypothetical protein
MIELSSKLRQNFVKTLLIIVFNISSMQGMYFLGKETLKNTIVDAILEAKFISRTVNNLSIWSLIKIGFSKETIVSKATSSVLSAIIGIGSMSLTALFYYLITKKTVYKKIIQSTKDIFENDILKRDEFDENKIRLTGEQQELIKEYQNKSVLFMGPQGTGKSTIMGFIGIDALQDGSNVYWITNDIFSYTSLSNYGFPITNATILKSIFDDAQAQALKNKKPSYVLIDELHRSESYMWQSFNILLDYMNNKAFKQHVRILATTTDDQIRTDIYRPGRLELKIIYSKENPLNINEKFTKIEEYYNKMKKESFENQ